MTKFITYFNLCPIPEPKDFLGISADKEEGNIITTLDKNIIIIIKISTQKQIRSWTVIEKLSTKVVYDKCSEKYVGVFGGKAIRCWDENTVNINKCKKLKFQRSIAELISNEEETLVLYSDGSCESLQAAIQSRKESRGELASQQLEYTSKLRFTNAGFYKLPNGNRIVTYFERNNSNDDLHLVRLSLQNTNQPIRRFKLKRDDLDVHVAGFAVIEGDGTPVLLTIWSDKRIFLLSLGDDILPEASPGIFVSMLTQLKVDSPLSVLGISGHFVVIYGANHGQEGASLLLYNTQYKVVKTKQFFKVYFDFSQLWSKDNYIILAMGQNLSAVQYRILKEILSELVGTQINNDYHVAIEDDHINEEELLEDCLEYCPPFSSRIEHSHTETTSLNHTKSQTVFRKIVKADGKTVPFIRSDDFHKKLNEWTQTNLHVELLQVDESLDEAQVILMNNYHDHGFKTPEIHMIAMQLEKVGASEHEITEKLLTVLIKANLLQDIEVCLKRYTNISEKVLSKTLQYLLKRFKQEQQQNVCSNDNVSKINGTLTNGTQIDVDVDLDSNSTDPSDPFPNADLLAAKVHTQHNKMSDVTRILNTALSCSIEPTAIVSYIRKDIEYTEVLLMLQHLYNLLTDPEITDFEERPTSNHNVRSDFEMQLFRWFGILLDTHFQKLALSQDGNLMELLFKWHQLFLLYKNEIDELEKVAALLYNIVERRKLLNSSNCSKWYSIEEVDLF